MFELQSETPEADFDLLRDLEERLEKVERHSGVNADLVFEGSLDDCPAEWRENLRGIAVEALNNVLKHAQAKNVCLTIRCKPGQVELEVQDDGKGFDLTKVRSGGMGLTTMRTRAELLGGKLAFEAVPTGGTRVKFILEEKAENP